MRVNIEVTAGPARGRVFNIDQADLFIVGRARDSKISLPNDPYLSRQHFVLEIAPPNCRITDLGSKNGTFVNGVRYGGRKADPLVKQAPNNAMSVAIQSGEIVVGDTRMKIRVDGLGAAKSAPVQEGEASQAVPGSGVRQQSSALINATRLEVPREGVGGRSRPGPAIAASAPAEPEDLSVAGESSLGFLTQRQPGAASLQAAHVPTPPPIPKKRPSNLYAVPVSGQLPRSDAELKRHSTPIPGDNPSVGQGSPLNEPQPTPVETLKPASSKLKDERPADSGAPTVRNFRGFDPNDFDLPPTVRAVNRSQEPTLLEAPPPGVDRDRTVRERISSDDTPPGIPLAEGEQLACALCGADATHEVGARGRVAGAEYVCSACRASRAFAAKERMARKAAAPRPASSGPKLTALPGMDVSKYASLSYPGYDVTDVLGSGGMGVVYKATRQSDGKTVAIKSLLPDVPVSFENYRIFHREIEITSKLRHPNIVEVLDHGRVKGAYYCVLEFVDGLSLKDFIIQMGGKVSLKQAAPLMLDILSGLSAAHLAQIETRASGPKMQSGIVHRDLKPENILLARDAFGWIPKIADFGIAKSFESAGMTDMTIAGVCGTPTYWPREQLTHYRYLHPATDVFSIAAVFFEMLAGKCARPGMHETLIQCQRRSVSPELADFMRVIGNNPIPPIRDVVPTIPPAIAAVLDKALLECEVPLDEVEMRETLRDLRYPDAGAFREALAVAFKSANIGI